jgi:small conductance mechanosensitive channel
VTDVFSFLSLLANKIGDIATTYIPRIILSIAVYVIGKLLINWVAYSAKRIISKRELDPSLQSFLNSLIRISLHLFLIVTVMGMMGINLTSFAAILAGLAVGVGAALNGTLGNFAGGVMILLFKPFRLGDFIEAQGYSGKVIELGIFNTYLLSVENKTIILANGALSTGTIVNHTKHGNIRVETSISIPNTIDLSLARNIIIEELLNNQNIMKDPSPEVNISKIEDGSMVLSIRAYCQQNVAATVFFQMQEQLRLLLDKYRIEITNKSVK